jgi:hypothetical protein
MNVPTPLRASLREKTVEGYKFLTKFLTLATDLAKLRILGV